jgi:GNAT superfamily N-acetyltransferase
MSIDIDRGLALQRGSISAWFEFLAGRSEGARVVELEGVTAAMLPATPDRSVTNSVTYEAPAALAAALDTLAAEYDAAGVRAWTVWAPAHDAEATALLERAGHKFDARPAAMTLELVDSPDVDLGDLAWDSAADPVDVGRVNDLAYGWEGPAFATAIGSAPVEAPARLYQARVDGEVACVLQTIDREGDCGIYFVATLPSNRGQGLARRLMSVALAEARERGCETSTLQASPMGEPVYERLGYQTTCRLHMYERRK